MEHHLSFSCDYMEGAHPRILQRLIETNLVQTPGYGLDSYCTSAKEKIRSACQAPDADIFFLTGGTQTNATVIDAVLKSYQGVIAAETGHISVHEAGAIELGGHKVLTLPHQNGKISASQIRTLLETYENDANHDHMVMPGIVYLSHPTEYGTLYSEKVSSTLQLPCPSILRGGVFFFLLLRHNYLMNILQNIFNDHYEEMVYILHPRQVVIDNVTKMINCGDPAFGGAMYSCPKCSNLKFVPFRCKSKFCPTCGIKYCQDRANSMAFQLIQCSHRHCVFTIDEDLRHFFLEDRSLLDCLFHAVRSVILRMFFKLNMSRNFVPGFICVLHTFGRPLEWNPHIHCLVTEGGFSDDGFWRIVKHFDYTLLRMSFQTALLNEMEKQIGPSFKKIKAAIYKKDSNGFYVYAKPNLCDTKTVTKYISRYLGRPVIALNRIDSYDGKNVTFHYHRHEDNAFVKKCIPALDFISLLIQHIPEHHYKMIRYYGLYARHRNNDKKLRRAIPKNRQPIIRSFTKWRNNIALSFGYDPLCCPNCKIGMTLTDLYFNHKRIPLEEMYERTLAKFKCRSA